MNDDVERNARVRARTVSVSSVVLIVSDIPADGSANAVPAGLSRRRELDEREEELSPRRNRESYAKISGRKQGTLNARVEGAGAYYCLPACESVLIREDRPTVDIYAAHAKPRPSLSPELYIRGMRISGRARAKCRAASARRFPRGGLSAREGGRGTQRDRVFYFGAAPAARGNEGNKAGNRNAKREVGNYAITSAPRVRRHLCTRRDWIAGKICAAGR